MASQYSTDIPFTASHSQQAFKLLELPPELLALFESDNPPTLTITSSEPTVFTPGYATLCYGDKKYQMRQKNTSNPIMILKPSTTEPTDADDKETFIPAPSITAIAKIEDTIELILQEEGPAKAPPKVNKWHEKFAKSRMEKKGERTIVDDRCAVGFIEREPKEISLQCVREAGTSNPHIRSSLPEGLLQ